ncbi:class I SAM-dependent methyltransferase [Fodinicola acaciae]|uniref:class I SAM-dependent methyltransferase n=1 Tax=Fodinicola acaciae TaxID=2681555 RepID=UPI0013D797A5|nr:class I SAM-dependent methyltransferase [Fodinicola acaciae]
MTEKVGSQPQYDTFADEFLDHARDGFANAYLDRPACLDLLGDVAGTRILDAACGPGLYAQELVSRGATVTGLDISPRMVELARERVPAGDFHVHDLNKPLDLPDDAYDLVLFPLALEYLDERVAALSEFRRVLRKDGALVFSRMHPTGDWLRHGGSYFDARVIEETWSTGWRVRNWLAPLQQTCDELWRAGFLIERLVEPRPVPEAETVDPEDYARLLREPRGFLAIRAIPDTRARRPAKG